MINMVDPIAKLDADGELLGVAMPNPHITLTNTYDCILYTGNLWPVDSELAKKEFDELTRFEKAKKELVKVEQDLELDEDTRKQKKELLNVELERLEHKSELIRLSKIFPEFVKKGLPILAGISSPIFSDEDAKNYGKARSKIKYSLEEILPKEEIAKFENENLLIRHAASRLIDQMEQAKLNKDTLRIDTDIIDAANLYVKLGQEATTLAGDRYTALVSSKLVNTDGILIVRGKSDRRSTAVWEGVAERGTTDIKLDPKKPDYAYRVAYFGGYNYEEDRLYDSPDELIAPIPVKGDLEKWLEETEFDAMVFSGSAKRLNQAIKNVNEKRKKNKPKLHNKIFIVSDSDSGRVRIGYDDEKHNLIVDGVNYYPSNIEGSKVGKMLLLDPRSNSLFVVKKSADGDSPLSGSYEVLESYNYRNGRIIQEVDFDKRNDRSSSTLAGWAAGIGNFYKRNRTAIEKATINCLKYGVPFVLGTAAGVLGYSYFEDNSDNVSIEKLNKEVKSQQEIIDEYNDLVNKYITQRTAKKE